MWQQMLAAASSAVCRTQPEFFASTHIICQLTSSTRHICPTLASWSLVLTSVLFTATGKPSIPMHHDTLPGNKVAVRYYSQAPKELGPCTQSVFKISQLYWTLLLDPLLVCSRPGVSGGPALESLAVPYLQRYWQAQHFFFPSAQPGTCTALRKMPRRTSSKVRAFARVRQC